MVFMGIKEVRMKNSRLPFFTYLHRCTC